jgi:hypothetical protein
MGQIHNSISDSNLYYQYISIISKNALSFTELQKKVEKSKSIVHRQIKVLLDNKYIVYSNEKKKYCLNKEIIQKEFLIYFLKTYEKSDIIFFLIKYLIKETDSATIREIYSKIVTYFVNAVDNDYEQYLESGKEGLLYEDFEKIKKTENFKICEKLKKILKNYEDEVYSGLEYYYKNRFQK